MPDRDNPFLWRARTKEGRRGAVRLLEELTDEEVTRYMQMAADQVRLEERWMGLQLLAAAIAIGIVVYDMADGLKNGLTSLHVTGLLLGAALGYWPWRVRACRRMWLKHQNAAKAELLRRKAVT